MIKSLSTTKLSKNYLEFNFLIPNLNPLGAILGVVVEAAVALGVKEILS